MDRKPWAKLAHCLDPPQFWNNPGTSGLSSVLDIDCFECSYLFTGYLYHQTGKHGSPGSILCDVSSHWVLGSRKTGSRKTGINLRTFSYLFGWEFLSLYSPLIVCLKIPETTSEAPSFWSEQTLLPLSGRCRLLHLQVCPCCLLHSM